MVAGAAGVDGVALAMVCRAARIGHGSAADARVGGAWRRMADGVVGVTARLSWALSVCGWQRAAGEYDPADVYDPFDVDEEEPEPMSEVDE